MMKAFPCMLEINAFFPLYRSSIFLHVLPNILHSNLTILKDILENVIKVLLVHEYHTL